MKIFLYTLLKFLLFFVVFAIGSFASPFHVQTNLDHSNHLPITHYFIWDGLLLSLALFVLVLVVETLRKKFRAAAPWTTLAFLFTMGLGLAMKLGFITRDF
jgi:hypothetical protein